MSVIIILVSASLIIASGFLAAFIWSVKDGQYEDDYTPSVRILFNDVTEPPEQPPVPETRNPQPEINNN